MYLMPLVQHVSRNKPCWVMVGRAAAGAAVGAASVSWVCFVRRSLVTAAPVQLR